MHCGDKAAAPSLSAFFTNKGVLEFIEEMASAIGTELSFLEAYNFWIGIIGA
jgi:hypothetical protein